MKKSHSLLSPAGNFACLKAAVAAGADAVYFGVGDTNARCYADNFTLETAKEAIRYCRFHGVETDVTLNISVYDREFSHMLSVAESLYKAGADAFIVADLGLASELKRRLPEAVLHASTQAMGHSVGCAEMLFDVGFSRMVLARELSIDDVASIASGSPIESEMFIHGACCASASGSCLMSAAVGGRSGNRGKCAGPCRLSYSMGGSEGRLLSLSDLCYAGHIEEILKYDIAALKIEGRMKPPEYVYGVTKIYRALIDERRNASASDLALLQRYFSRPFSDAYLEGKSQPVSGEPKKAETPPAVPSDLTKKRGVNVRASLVSGRPFSVTASCGGYAFTAEGAVPEAAKSAPLSIEKIEEQLKKTGDLPFFCAGAEVDAEPLFLTVSAMNDTRRRAYAGLYDIMTAPPERAAADVSDEVGEPTENPDEPARYAFFTVAGGVTEKATSFFDRIYLPLSEALKANAADARICASLPPVVHPSEEDETKAMIEAALKRGIRRFSVYNLGHARLVSGEGVSVLADIGANVFNEKSARIALRYADEITVSPELGLGAAADVCARVPSGYTVYGRLPLMILQSCIVKDAVGCKRCTESMDCGDGFFRLRDRTGTAFPVRGSEHRTVVYNSVPVYMADKAKSLPPCRFRAWRFTCESPEECDRIIGMYEREEAPDFPCMRIQKYNLEARNDR